MNRILLLLLFFMNLVHVYAQNITVGNLWKQSISNYNDYCKLPDVKLNDVPNRRICVY